MQHPVHSVDTSEFGEYEQLILGGLASSFESNQVLVEQIKRGINPKFQEIIAAYPFSNDFKIFTTIIGEYKDWSYLRGGQFLFKTHTIGIAVKIANFYPKRNEDPLKCIEIHYMKDRYSLSQIINIETLRPTFDRLIFTDLESVVFAINKILQEIFYQPMIDRMAAQKIPVLIYQKFLIEARKENKKPIIEENRSSVLLGTKSKKHWIQQIVSFLGDSDAGNYYVQMF
jgi:hypothetical protein